MRMDRAEKTDGPIIAAIGPNGFRIDDGYYPALLMTPTRADSWSPPPLEALTIDDLASLLGASPEFILLGTGATLARPPRALVKALEAKNIGIDPMDSRAAARAWAVLRGEGRLLAAAIYSL
jgi:uncharacterized protein